LIGRTLVHYEITEKIGEGGMGQVYRARDGKLGREVALKILPKEMSGDVERILRFAREARTLASLQHANVASVYGYEEVDGIRFLVMELVEGEDLQEHLRRGPIPLDDAVDIARQIAAGLEAAHDQGIIHRDLKPANIKLSPSGEIKVLDFGLARAYLGDATDASDINNSPTITAAMTGAGVILGTAAYMSPEQARGKRVDTRTDLWAFGVILYEMLTGRRLFAGETVSDTLAAVLRAEPDMSALPTRTPPSIHRLLRRCLERDVRLRLRSAGDALLELLEVDDADPQSPVATQQPRILWGLVAVLALALAFSVLLRPSLTGPLVSSLHLDISPPAGSTVQIVPPALSPDGRWLAFVARDSVGRAILQLRSLVRYSTEALTDPGIEALNYPEFLFWSPDSRHLGIQSRGSLSSLDIDSRSVQNIHEEGGMARGASWGANGELIYAPNSNSGIWTISSIGGTPRVLTEIDTTLADASHRWPAFLPDGSRFLFTTWSNATKEREMIGGIFVSSLDGAKPVQLLNDASMAVLDPAGQLLFHRNGKLMRVEFDLDAAQIHGNPSLIADEVSWDPNNGLVMATVSGTGDLLYSTNEASQEHSIGWAAADGSFGGFIDAPGYLFSLDLSPDRRFAAVEWLSIDSSDEIWIADLDRRTLSRLSRFDGDSWAAKFSPDGRRVAYTNQTLGSERIYAHGIDGATDPEILVDQNTLSLDVTDWSADGRLLFYDHSIRRTDISQIGVYDFTTGETRTLLEAEFSQSQGTLSPDGRWLAYVSTESGREEVYVRPYPALNRKWRISVDGGTRPDWNADGTALLYATKIGEFFTVPIVAEGDELVASSPRFVRSFGRDYSAIAVDTSHTRFLVARRTNMQAPTPLHFVSNWRAALESESR